MTKINENHMTAREYVTAIHLAMGFIEHFIDKKEVYKKSLDKERYEGIKKIIPEILEFAGEELVKMLSASIEGKKETESKTNLRNIGCIYFFARCYILGVQTGDIEDEREIMNMDTLKYVSEIVKRGEKFDKWIEED
ncbi:MAG: hypothetical protein J6R32_00285 [Bacteroidales bacterium]|nr:hypothetical protein [Bacteroidales bacterium]